MLNSQGGLDRADLVLSAQHRHLGALSKPPLPHQLGDLRHSTQHGVGQGEGRGIGCHGGLRLKRLQMRRLRDYQIGGKTNTAAYLCEFCDKRYAMFYDGVRFVANLRCYSLHLFAISCNEMQAKLFYLKSLDVRVVPVRFRPRAPLKLKKKPYRLNRYDASLRRFCFTPPPEFLSHFC